MNKLQQIFDFIKSDEDSLTRIENKRSLYSIINFLSSSRKGIYQYDINNYIKKNGFENVFQKLVNKSIVEQSNNGKYLLNKQIRPYLYPNLEGIITGIPMNGYSKTNFAE